MSIEKDPIQGVATAVILAFLGAIGVKIKREYHRITGWLKKVLQMARGNGISVKEHNAAIDDLKAYVKELVDNRTYPIQPNSNGGDSLPDLFKLVNGIKDRMEHRFDRVEDQANEIAKTAHHTAGMLETHIDTKNAH